MPPVHSTTTIRRILCDFGGTGMIVNTNPITGSCVYPTSSSSSSITPPSQPVSTAPPATPPPPPITTATTTRDRDTRVHYTTNSFVIKHSGISFRTDSPTFVNTSTSRSSGTQLRIRLITL